MALNFLSIFQSFLDAACHCQPSANNKNTEKWSAMHSNFEYGVQFGINFKLSRSKFSKRFLVYLYFLHNMMQGRHQQHLEATTHSIYVHIYIRTVISQRLLSKLLIQLNQFMDRLGRSTCLVVNLISAPDQSERVQMYHYIREPKSVLSEYIYILWPPPHIQRCACAL